MTNRATELIGLLDATATAAMHLSVSGMTRRHICVKTKKRIEVGPTKVFLPGTPTRRLPK